MGGSGPIVRSWKMTTWVKIVLNSLLSKRTNHWWIPFWRSGGSFQRHPFLIFKGKIRVPLGGYPSSCSQNITPYCLIQPLYNRYIGAICWYLGYSLKGTQLFPFLILTPSSCDDDDEIVTSPKDPGSPKVRMVSWNLNTLFFFWGDGTPQSSSSDVRWAIGSPGKYSFECQGVGLC